MLIVVGYFAISLFSFAFAHFLVVVFLMKPLKRINDRLESIEKRLS